MVNIPGYQEDKHDNLPQRKLGPGWKKKEKKKERDTYITKRWSKAKGIVNKQMNDDNY